MIDFSLGAELELVRDTVREFAGAELRPRQREFEKARSIPQELASQAHALGLGVLGLPESCGGQAMGVFAEVVVAEELAAADPGFAAAMPGPGAAATFILGVGDDAAAQRWLAPFATDAGAARRGALAWNDAPDTPVIARQVDGGFALSGRKCFVRHAPDAELVVVRAQLGEGPEVGVFVVDGAALQGTRHETCGLHAAQIGDLCFDDVTLPAEAWLGGAPIDARRQGELLARAALVPAAWCVGASRASYEHALRYGHEREAFGKPIAHFQAIAFNLADLHMEVEAARHLLWRAALALDAGPQAGGQDSGDDDARHQVLAAIAQAQETVMRVCNDGVQLLGGAGYVQDHPSEKWMRDARVLSVLGHTREGAELAIATRLLGDAAQRPSEELAQTSQLQPAIT